MDGKKNRFYPVILSKNLRRKHEYNTGKTPDPEIIDA